jgi:hypothetical protein
MARSSTSFNSKTGTQAQALGIDMKKYVNRVKKEEWEFVGKYLMTEGSEKFIEVIKELPPGQFISAYLAALEYFKPKLARKEVDVTSKGERMAALIMLPPEDKPGVRIVEEQKPQMLME